MSSKPPVRRTAPRRARPRGGGRSPRTGRRIGAAVAIAAIAAAGAWFGWEHVRSRRVVLRFTGEGAAQALELTFFPEQLAFGAPSPPPPIGRLTVDPADAVSVGSDLVPGSAVVRYSGPGIGSGFRFVRLGETVRDITLRAPKTLRGRVGEPIAAWSAGWRCVGFRPVAGAAVVLMGGGEHGIELASARTDAGGSYEITGVDLDLDGLGLRVRAAGFAIHHQPVARASVDEAPPAALARTRAWPGRLVVPSGVDPTALRILARGLPGVEATPGPDGSFVLDHVPPGTAPRLLVHGLPPSLTHAAVRAVQGPLQIEVLPAAGVRGRVVDGRTGEAVGGALVYCGEEPAVRAAADGTFELSRLPPGPTEIRAQSEPLSRRGRVLAGAVPLRLEGGRVAEGIVVTVE